MRAIWSEIPTIPKYISVGVMNTILGFFIYASLIFFGFPPSKSQFIGRLFGIVINFGTYRSWVFSKSRFSFRRYVVAYLANYLVAWCLLAFFYSLVGDPYFAGFMTILIAAGTNFVSLRYFVSQASRGGAKGRAYRPHPIDWRFLPEWCLVIKDAAHDAILFVFGPLIRLAPLRYLWLWLIGREIERVVAIAGVQFVHIPKNGGTSISKLLYNRNIPHLSAVELRERFGDRLDAYPSFAVLRHPVDRFVSAFRFTVSGGSDLILTSRFERWRLGSMHSLEAFLDRLDAYPQLTRIAVQFRPQIDFIRDREGRLMPDHLFAFTKQGQMPPALIDWLALVSMPHINKTAAPSIEVDERSRQRIIAMYRDDMVLFDQVTAAGGCLTQAHTRRQTASCHYPEIMPQHNLISI